MKRLALLGAVIAIALNAQPVTKNVFLVIERDNFEGAAAAFKKIFVVKLDEVDDAGFLVKREVADLLQIRDPHNLGGQGPLFRFAFQTIESVIPLGRSRLGILDDNNYPFSNGRVPGQPDPNEFIVIRLDTPLAADDELGDRQGQGHERGRGSDAVRKKR